MSDGLMVEEKCMFTVLVIEEDQDSRLNALEAVGKRAMGINIVGTLAEARQFTELLKEDDGRTGYDAILCDIRFPRDDGQEPSVNVSAVLELCRTTGVPVCFVTKADPNGMPGDGGYVILKATTQGRVLQSELEALNGGYSEEETFRKLLTTEICFVKSGSKSPLIWGLALQMALNAGTRPTIMGKAMREARKTGLELIPAKGAPRAVPRR